MPWALHPVTLSAALAVASMGVVAEAPVAGTAVVASWLAMGTVSGFALSGST